MSKERSKFDVVLSRNLFVALSIHYGNVMKKIIIILGTIFLFSCASQIENIEPKGRQNKLPRTVSDAVSIILSEMSEDDRRLIKNTKKDDLIRFHHGWGTGIRNEFGLWCDNEKLIESACGKGCHPDDASMVIIEAVWEELQQRP